jgi:hypothetical protein
MDRVCHGSNSGHNKDKVYDGACTKTLSLYLSMKPCTRRLLGGRAQGVDTGKSLDARRRGEGGD